MMHGAENKSRDRRLDKLSAPVTFCSSHGEHSNKTQRYSTTEQAHSININNLVNFQSNINTPDLRFHNICKYRCT
ncbi:unnamed protein product [Ixodes pacificus]